MNFLHTLLLLLLPEAALTQFISISIEPGGGTSAVPLPTPPVLALLNGAVAAEVSYSVLSDAAPTTPLLANQFVGNLSLTFAGSLVTFTNIGIIPPRNNYFFLFFYRGSAVETIRFNITGFLLFQINLEPIRNRWACFLSRCRLWSDCGHSADTFFSNKHQAT